MHPAPPADTPAPPGPVCLDVTRLVSRVGLGAPTGIDRVEAAYLRALLAAGGPLWLLARLADGQALIDRAGAVRLAQCLSGATGWDRVDWRGALSRRLAPARRRAEATLRRLALARADVDAMGPMLARHLPAGTTWLNTGHSNLSVGVLAAWRTRPGARIAVLLHDAIPLDFPQFQRPGMAERFAGMLDRVAGAADLVICNSAHTRDRLRHHLGRRAPRRMLVAHLGIDLLAQGAGAPPPGLAAGPPAFVCLGTIEPRKNHALLLDVWERLAREMPHAELPHLHIAGRRGWCSAALFARIAAVQRAGLPVFEHNALPDAAVAALLARARALLLPSRAEGFGLPAFEAAAAGLPLVCADLPVWRELLGDWPIRHDPDDVAAWAASVRRLSRAPVARPAAPALPTWEAHFAHVFAALAPEPAACA